MMAIERHLSMGLEQGGGGCSYGYNWAMMSTMMAIERQLSVGLEQGGDPGAVVKSACLGNIFLGKSEIAGLCPTGIQVSKKQIATYSLTCKNVILCGASVTES